MRRIPILHDGLIYLAWVVAVFVRIIILEGVKMKELAVLKNEVVGAICSGIRKADREYGRWTGDEGLCEAPEYLVTCAIARELAKPGDGRFVTLEANVQETLRCARVRFRGRPGGVCAKMAALILYCGRCLRLVEMAYQDRSLR
ncbi:hypothetical protein DK842_00405 [Chromobacterium phragmitis]|nr:hypothetical protein DK842_00405 [Chromobacterium phragmitis]